MNCCISGLAWKRHPLATFTSSTPFPFQSLRNSSSNRRRTSVLSWSSNNFLSSDRGKGSWLTSNAVSRIRLTSAGLDEPGKLDSGKGTDWPDINDSKSTRLANFHLIFSHKFQQGQKSYHKFRHSGSGIE